MLLPILFPHGTCLFLWLHQLAVWAGNERCLLCSLTVQSVLSFKAECHPGMVLELETVLFLHADLLLDVCCAKR